MTSKTITLTGSEQKIIYGAGCNAWLRNDGTEAVNASCSAGISAGGDGIVSIPAGQSAPVFGANGTVYLLGAGSVQLIGSDYSANPFKTSAQSGGSGADEVARTAINSHSANAGIHVTADEKTAWNGKADKSDIPEKLPADGGNADTVDGRHAIDIMNMACSSSNRSIVSASADLDNLLTGGRYLIPSISEAAAIEHTAFDNIGYYLDVYRNGVNDASNVIVQIAMNYSGTIKIRSRTNGTFIWSSWVNINDGGNAAAVKDFPISLSGERGIPVINADNGTLEIGQRIDFHSANGQDYAIRLFVSPADWDSGSGQPVLKILTPDGRTANINDGGNATTLGDHAASDFVLKSEYDALAARVAALEGGT